MKSATILLSAGVLLSIVAIMALPLKQVSIFAVVLLVGYLISDIRRSKLKNAIDAGIAYAIEQTTDEDTLDTLTDLQELHSRKSVPAAVLVGRQRDVLLFDAIRKLVKPSLDAKAISAFLLKNADRISYGVDYEELEEHIVEIKNRLNALSNDSNQIKK